MEAFGKPGIAPTWSSSDKDLIGTALGTSRLWFTMSHGIINEVFWPATGEPQIRDLGFLVAGDDFWAEVKRVNRYTLTTPNPATPLPMIVHEHEQYRLTLRVVPDPDRDVLLIAYRLEGDGMRLYPLLAPHLGGSGWGNTAWVAGEALLAQKGQNAVALVGRFLRGSAGYVGFSDGWQDMAHNGRMTWTFDRAEDGNVALMGELAEPEGVLALAFATTPEGAVTLARSSLAEGIDRARSQVLQEWRRFTRGIQLPSA
ncbi:MAG: glucan 1,4-alpha-glucosidase, partial [Thermorudis peleae]|nr:glucan 1,4-alpha-glucosidase [Thermorudis peleae]